MSQNAAYYDNLLAILRSMEAQALKVFEATGDKDLLNRIEATRAQVLITRLNDKV